MTHFQVHIIILVQKERVMDNKKLQKLNKIIDYCKMKNNTSISYFRQKKYSHKSIIKKEIYFSRYLKGSTYINPNINKLIRNNHETAQRIQMYLNKNFSVR